MKNIIDLICVIVNNAQAHGVWVSLRKTRKLCFFFHFVLWKLCRSQRCPTGLRRSPVHQIPRNVLGPIASLERNVSHTNSEAAITNKTCGVTKTVVLTNQIHLAWKYYLLLFWIYYIFKTILTTPIGEMLSMSLLIVV